MTKFRFTLALFLLIATTQTIAKGDNPFAKSVDIDFGTDIAWQVKNKQALKSGESSDGTYYHLGFDGKQLRLRVGESQQDTESAAKNFDQFAVEDIKVDGKRLPLFQWCLKNQERHARFLQQGLSVKKNICANQGEKGAFLMNLNQASLDRLKSGKKLSITIRPYRTSMTVNYTLADFSAMVDKLITPASVAPAAVVAVPVVPAKPSLKVAAPVTKKQTCKIDPPAGMASLKPVKYICDNAASKANANKAMVGHVNVEKARLKKVAAEKERKRLAAQASKKKAEEEAKRLEEEKKAEQEAIAASQLKQEAIGAEIAAKMLGVCNKMWNKGEHRCYCEKYIDKAPASIQASSTCSGG